jgi:hypothetical protein
VILAQIRIANNTPAIQMTRHIGRNNKEAIMTGIEQIAAKRIKV